MPNILITGPAGSGKSYLSKKWTEKGVNTIDGDAMTDVCRWFDKDGNRDEFPEDINKADAAWFSSHVFIWDVTSLAEFLQKNEPIVVLGTCDNITNVVKHFDRVYYLKIPFNIAKERLMDPERQAFTAFGKHEEQRIALEKMIADADKKAVDLGMTIIDAALPADEILSLIDLS
ncbi:MAG: hypothetical protein WCT28_03680 [Patescibacteria group bacterium]|jgi:dephospho-CoA kinase